MIKGLKTSPLSLVTGFIVAYVIKKFKIVRWSGVQTLMPGTFAYAKFTAMFYVGYGRISVPGTRSRALAQAYGPRNRDRDHLVSYMMPLLVI